MSLSKIKGRAALKSLGGLALVTSAVAACVPGAPGPYEGIGYRDARFEEIAAMREYRSCVDQGVQQTEQADVSGQVAGYLAAAKLLESCEANLGPEAQQVAEEERMQAYAVSIINYIKGGDLAQARSNLENFEAAFPEHDLTLANGNSFIDTVTLLTAGVASSDAQEVAFLNVGRDVRGEMSRVRFWKRN